jgi:hypothetical protein
LRLGAPVIYGLQIRVAIIKVGQIFIFMVDAGREMGEDSLYEDLAAGVKGCSWKKKRQVRYLVTNIVGV